MNFNDIPTPDGTGDSCCYEGWRTEDQDLKEACDVIDEIRVFDEDDMTCMLVNIEITPSIYARRSTEVVLNSCCEHANGDP